MWYNEKMKGVKKWCLGDSDNCINSVKEGDLEDHMPVHYYELYKRYKRDS